MQRKYIVASSLSLDVSQIETNLINIYTTNKTVQEEKIEFVSKQARHIKLSSPSDNLM